MVGKLDEHDAHVLHHGEQHLAEHLELRRVLFRLLCRLPPARQGVDLRHAHHALGKISDGRAEFFAQWSRRVSRNLVAPEQQRRSERFVIETQVKKDARGLERVR